MKILLKTLLMMGGLGVAGLLSSCQAPVRLLTPTSAVTCHKCGTVYFQAPATTASPGGKGLVTLRDSSSMGCVDCDSQVMAWVKTGKLTTHVCKTCGGALNHCIQH